MPLHDLVQAVPGLVVAVLLPGYALATLLAPRWRAWERLAAAPGLSAGFLGVLGLSMRLGHVPFEPVTVLPCVGVLVVAATLRRRRSASSSEEDRSPWWIPVPALLAGAVGAAVFAIALHDQALPPDWDAPVHGGLANSIATTHDVFPLVPVPLEGTLFAISRPGFEAMAAVVSWVGGPPPAASMAPAVTTALLLMPLGIAMLVLEATGSVALAMVAPLFAAGLAFPSDQAILGRFPLVTDSTLVAPLIVAGQRLLRGRQQLDNALIIVAATAAIWVVHGIEILTAVVVGGALLAATALSALRRSPRAALLRSVAAVAAVAAGAALVTVLTRLPKVPPALHPEPSGIDVARAHLPVHLHELLQYIAQADLTSPVSVALVFAGISAVLVRRRALWVLVAEVVVLLAMADNLYLHRLASFWRTVYPWGDTDRLLGLQYWLIPILLGAGVLAVADAVRALARRRSTRVAVWSAAVPAALVLFLARGALSRAWTSLFGSPQIYLFPLGVFDRLVPLVQWRTVIGVAVAALVVAWIATAAGVGGPAALRARLGPAAGGLDAAAAAVTVVALLALGVGARAELTVYQGEVVNRGLATPADLIVLRRMADTLPRGALILTDGLDDAGMWVAGVTDLSAVLPKSFEGGPLGLPLVLALQQACSDPAGAERALQHADAVFVGSHRLPGASHPWNVACIARLPGLRQIASAPWAGTKAAAFAVVR